MDLVLEQTIARQRANWQSVAPRAPCRQSRWGSLGATACVSLPLFSLLFFLSLFSVSLPPFFCQASLSLYQFGPPVSFSLSSTNLLCAPLVRPPTPVSLPSSTFRPLPSVATRSFLPFALTIVGIRPRCYPRSFARRESLDAKYNQWRVIAVPGA